MSECVTCDSPSITLENDSQVCLVLSPSVSLLSPLFGGRGLLCQSQDKVFGQGGGGGDNNPAT